MSSIQETLDGLKPYVISIRTVGALSVVDAVFEDGWTIPPSELVQFGKDENQPNYYMFFSEEEGIGFDEILEYVESIIKLNLEMKMKYELLRVKVKELQEVFKSNSLAKLKTLKFTFGGNSLQTNGSGDDVDDLINSASEVEEEKVVEKVVEQVKPKPKPPKPEQPKQEPKRELAEVSVSVEDMAIHEANGQKIELPPKQTRLPEKEVDPRKVELEDHSIPEHLTSGACNCGPEEACPKCMDTKGMM